MREIGLALAVVVAGIAISLMSAGNSGAAERDLWSGLAYLRAGAQPQAERDLTRYRDEERDPEIQRRIDRVLPLLKRPLAEDVREYIAATLEEGAAPRVKLRGERSKPSYWSRMFPVFP